MTPKGATASAMRTVMAKVPKMAGSTPPSVFASRGSSVRNSLQRERYTPALPQGPRRLAG